MGGQGGVNVRGGGEIRKSGEGVREEMKMVGRGQNKARYGGVRKMGREREGE